jgi:hypothetical protein
MDRVALPAIFLAQAAACAVEAYYQHKRGDPGAKQGPSGVVRTPSSGAVRGAPTAAGRSGKRSGEGRS